MKLGRNLKKAIAIGALAAMASVMALPVYATNITVSNAVNEKTYYAYKIFDVTHSGDKVAYTLDASTEEGGKIYNALKDAGVFDFTKTATGEYVVTLKSGKTDEDVSKAVKENFSVGTDGKIADLTAAKSGDAANKKAILDVEKSGYYFVTTNNGTVVTVDTVKDTAISVIDKNKEPGWEKDPDSNDDDGEGKTVSNSATGTYKKANSVNIGEMSYFKINAYVPTISKGDKVDSYTITDTLGDGFTIDGDVTVTFTDDSGTAIAALNSLATTNVTNNKITVTFKIRDDDTHQVIANYDTETHVEITYKAKVDADAKNDNKNTVSMAYTVGDAGTDEKTVDDSVTDTYVYGFKFDKVDGGAVGKPNLAGATFELLDENETKINLVSAGTNRYRVASADDSSDKYVDITTGTATIEIFGLKELAADKNYYLREIEAPSGYNKLENPVEVKNLTGDNDLTTPLSAEIKTDAEVYVGSNVTVENNAGSILPSTGGAGRIALYSVGGVLVVGFGIVMVSKKRTSAE